MEHQTTSILKYGKTEPIPRIKAYVNQAGLIVEAALGSGDWQTVESRGFGRGEQPCYAVERYFSALDAKGIDYYRVKGGGQS